MIDGYERLRSRILMILEKLAIIKPIVEPDDDLSASV